LSSSSSPANPLPNASDFCETRAWNHRNTVQFSLSASSNSPRSDCLPTLVEQSSAEHDKRDCCFLRAQGQSSPKSLNYNANSIRHIPSSLYPMLANIQGSCLPCSPTACFTTYTIGARSWYVSRTLEFPSFPAIRSSGLAEYPKVRFRRHTAISSSRSPTGWFTTVRACGRSCVRPAPRVCAHTHSGALGRAV
jgi:hypothetical protein